MSLTVATSHQGWDTIGRRISVRTQQFTGAHGGPLRPNINVHKSTNVQSCEPWQIDRIGGVTSE